MRATILVILLISALNAAAFAAPDPLSYRIENIYKEPSESSQLIYKIPLELRLLDVSADGEWYKIKLEYKVGVVRFQYIGWTHIPVLSYVEEVKP